MYKRIIDFHLTKWRIDLHRKPLLLRGARQVGKTSAVRTLARQFDNFVEINFEQLPEAVLLFEGNLIPEKLIRSLSILMDISIIPGKTLLFFDEIQEAPRAITALRYFYEIMPELHIIAAGSLLEFTIAKIGIPVGRIATLYMYPMSFLEFLVATGRALAAEEILRHPPGTAMEKPIHVKILESLGEYLSIGGMPESVTEWVRTNDPKASLKALQQIADTYRQDFDKYAKKTQVKYLELLFRQVPHAIGQRFFYTQIHGEYKKRELAPALELLQRANIIHFVRHTSGQGIPLGADIDFDTFKVIYVDIALCQAIIGSNISVWFLRPLEGFTNRGDIAEAFVGQELLCYGSPHSKTDLYYWKRQEKNSSAEVDYLLQRSEDIIPVEVKSGHGSSLKSLRMFLETHPQSKMGMRFSSLDYSIIDQLDSRPLYAVASMAHSSQQDALQSLLR